MRATEFIIEAGEQDKFANAVVDFYANKVGDIKKQPVDNYVKVAKEILDKVEDTTIKGKILKILKQAKDNPYVQGGVVTTIGSLLAGGVLSSAYKMGLSPAQTNIMLQAILNTVIPTVVSRINGKSWADTAKYTLASAGIGTGIATLTEIERISKDDFTGGKDYLNLNGPAKNRKNIKPLPGKSGFYYHISQESMYGGIAISILDKSGKKTIGYLTITNQKSFPIPNTYGVHAITVDEDYRNQGIGKALYGIVLTILKVTLISGVSQTPGGRKNWLSLANIPGVDIKGYVVLEEYDIKTDREIDKKSHDKYDIERINRRNARAEKRINVLMGKLGGQYMGSAEDDVYFAFDVVPGTSELQPAVKTALSKLYYSEYDVEFFTGLYAQWSGK
jgi:GNAT superfamily N-acetyltransferase